ncbi:helix-turn-helix domain-containing protein [Trinickia terrae]|uniref:Helix-turn-helix domain-containing protein n=1 Tax=Trinickia terrae TaxID=2571161 RepID=A0A4U1HR39_9BURK|nr:YdaS family helix-turn-helix protein [Trinickia terrae]TKC83852.1 helix-turn-helix domain-containing protein [Trinickia terrae]
MEHFPPIKKACELAGGVTHFAKAIGVRPSTAHEWLTGRRPVPTRRCVQIEAKYCSPEVTRRTLRPSDWFEHWPELIFSSSSICQSDLGSQPKKGGA